MHDLVIDNARLIDGLGAPARDAASRSRTAPLRAQPTAAAAIRPARERVDAGGLVLAPGIVDIHPLRRQLTWDPFATPRPRSA